MAESREQSIRREHDSVDDFEHLEHVQDGLLNQQKDTFEENLPIEKDMMEFSSSEITSENPDDPRKATLLLLEAEKSRPLEDTNSEIKSKPAEIVSPVEKVESQSQPAETELTNQEKEFEDTQETLKPKEAKENQIPEPVIPADLSKKVPDSWSVIEDSQPTGAIASKDEQIEKEDSSSEYVFADATKGGIGAAESGKPEFESEAEASPAKSLKPVKQEMRSERIEHVEIAPKEIFSSIGIEAWFQPERLNPKVAALIYWHDLMRSGAVFGGILSLLLSLAYCSLISVVAYLSLLALTFTIATRIYKTVGQAIQKTSDGHPFKDILEMDLTLPTEKVHEVVDVAVVHINATVNELRRLFLIEDFIDSVKFGAVLWSLTYIGSWFNGMTLIIIGVVAMFTLPVVYELNKPQIDQNLALVHSKINELTNKLKSAIPLGKKAEPTKEE